MDSETIRAVTEECVDRIEERWRYYTKALSFKPEVPLSAVIETFTMPIHEFIAQNYPLLKHAPPNLFWMLIFRAIQKAETHPPLELSQAIEDLYHKFRTDNQDG